MSHHVLFGYHINAIALDWREKKTLLTNENKRIDDPRTKIVNCVDVKAQYKKKSPESLQNNCGRNFQYTKLSVIDFFATYKDISAT